MNPPRSRTLRTLIALAFSCGAAWSAHAQEQHAHVHGLLGLDVAVDGPTLTLAIDSPIDNLLGFEHAPVNPAEKKQAEQAIARLRAADTLFMPDPAAGCKITQVDLDAPRLGLGNAQGRDAAGHADLRGRFTFHCTDAARVRYLDVALFTAFRNLRQIDAQIAAPQGQFQRTLKRPNARLAWGK